jgi:hypothetical protein
MISLRGTNGEALDAPIDCLTSSFVVREPPDLLGPEQALGDPGRPGRIVGHNAAGVADHVGVAVL